MSLSPLTRRLSHPAAGGTAATSTTGPTLRRLRTALLAGTGLVLVTSMLLLYGANHTARTMRAEATPAVIGVINARQDLVAADAAAIAALSGPAVQLNGAGDDYVGDITLATQSLQQVAEVNAAGSAGNQQLQLLGSLISTYSSMIGQASADYARGEKSLGTAEVWYASDFVHMPNGILAQLASLDPSQPSLDRSEAAALSKAESSFWTNPWARLIWAVPVAVLLLLLLFTQIYLSRRLRRTLNPGLALATMLALAALLAGVSLAGLADQRLNNSVGQLSQLRRQIPGLDDATDQAGQTFLERLLAGQCPASGSGCALTLATVRSREQFAASHHPTVPPSFLPRQADELSRAADIDLGLIIGMGAGSVAAGLLVIVGLWRRINEYRYQA